MPVKQMFSADDIKRERNKFFASLLHHFGQREMFDGSTKMDDRFVTLMMMGHKACCEQLASMYAGLLGTDKRDWLQALHSDMEAIIDDPDAAAGIASMWSQKAQIALEEMWGPT